MLLSSSVALRHYVAGERGLGDGLRKKLIRANWGVDEIPDLSPTVTLGYTGQSFASDFPSLASRCDLLVCPLPRGGVSNVHLIYPPYGTAIGRVVVLHAGHQEKYYDAGTCCDLMIQGLMSAGYHVLGVCMPASSPSGGFNRVPLVLTKAAGGTMSFTNHEFQEAEADGVKTLRLFVDPVISAVRYVIETLRPLSVDMTGISGGGWTTDWCAALCRLIRRSAPVFGSLPFTLRPPGDVGDYEQAQTRPFWDPLRTHELGTVEALYALGSTGCVSGSPSELTSGLELGAPRKRLQVLGTTDPIFPIATIEEAVDTYNAAIQAATSPDLTNVWADTTTTSHAYTADCVAQILAFLA